MQFFSKRRPSRRIVVLRRSEPHLAEALECRLMLYRTYRDDLGSPDAVWSFNHISYSYHSTFLSDWDAPVTSDQLREAVEEALGAWTSVTPLQLVELPDSGPYTSKYDADDYPLIRWLGGQGIGSYARQPGDSGQAGDIFVNYQQRDLNNVLELATQLSGVALGMFYSDFDGPAVMNGNFGSGTPVYWDFHGLETGALQEDDIAGIRSLYGSGLGYVINLGGELNVYGTRQGDDLSIGVQNGQITVTRVSRVGGFTTSFTRPIDDGQSVVRSVNLHGSDGDDVFTIHSVGGIPVSVEGGAGNDTLNLNLAESDVSFKGGDGYDTVLFNDSGSPFRFRYNFGQDSGGRPFLDRTDLSGRTYRFLFAGSDPESMQLFTGIASDTVSVDSVPTGTGVVLNSAGGADAITLGRPGSFDQLRGDGFVINGNGGQSVLNINARSAPAGSSITFSDLSNGYHRISGLFRGGLIYQDGAVSSINLDMPPSASLFTFGSNAALNVTMHGQDNKAYLGLSASIPGVAITGPVSINAIDGGLAVDLQKGYDPTGRNATLTLSNVNNPVTTLVGATPMPLSFSGLAAFKFAGGPANDQLFVRGSPQFPLDIDMGDGRDLVELDSISNQFYDRDLNFITIPITLHGGSGAGDVLSINDRAGGMYQYHLDTAQIRGNQEQYGDGLQVDYFDFEQAVIIADSRDNRFDVEGVAANNDPGRLFTLNGGDGSDTVVLHPHTAAGVPTIRSNMIYYGETGQDTLTIDDSASTFGTNYRFYNYTGGFNGDIDFNGVTFTFHNDVNIVNLVGGSGNDTFNIDQFQTGSALSISGGGGDDSLTFTQAAQDLASNITSVRNFVFDGGPGANTFALFNQKTAEAWNYSLTGNYYLAQKPNYAFGFTLNNLSTASFRAGNQTDTFRIVKTPPSQHNFFFGGGGNDLFIVGAAAGAAAGLAALAAGGTVANIGGPLIFDGESGQNDQIVVDDSGDAIGRVVHVGQASVGAAPQDTLFADGAALSFLNAEALEVDLGQAADDVTAQPNATVDVSLNSPPGPDGPVDTLTVDLGGVENPISNPDGDSGGYYSDNRKPLSYSGFASVGTIATPRARIVGRHVFYNHSAFDGNDAAANAQDDASIATDKIALMPGEAPSFANVTSYARGINGIFVDVANLPIDADVALLSQGMLLRFGDGARGEVPPMSPDVSVRRGAGEAGSDRVALTWPDGAIANGFLRVTLLPGATTGLAAPDVFAFGNLVGDATDAGSTIGVNASDLVRVRNAIGSSRSIQLATDFNRDGVVNASDLVIVRNRVGTSITPPSFNLVVNGGFEQPVYDGLYQVFLPGDSGLSGWKIDGAGVASVGNYWQASEGTHSVELNNFAAGGISQTIATIAGQTYRISFDLSGQPNAGPAKKQLQVFWDGSLVDTETFDVTGRSLANMGWSHREVVVTATRSTTLLRFFGAAPANVDGGPAIDNVVVTSTGATTVRTTMPTLLGPTGIKRIAPSRREMIDELL